MADVTTASPSDMDPVQQASLSSTVSNIKNFAHASDLVIETLLTNMVAAQQSSIAFNQAIQSRCLNILLDPATTALANSIGAQQSAKVAMTTPPDTTGQLAMLATQVSALTQIVQGLAVSPASSSSKSKKAAAGAATPAEIAAATTK